VLDAIVLGCGYTGARVATRLLARGVRVLAVARAASSLAPVADAGAEVLAVDAANAAGLEAVAAAAARCAPGFGVVCTVPPVERGGALVDATAALLAATGRPARVVYVSSTSVYGAQRAIDASSALSPSTRAAALRVDAERAVAAGSWSWLVLRPAAIYGPGRGLHASGGATPRRAGDPDRVVSRIHVDDLAALCDAGLASPVTGALPVADRAPATAREVISFCAALGLATPPLPAPAGNAVPGRWVDGRAAFDALGVAIAFPSYREGILAALERVPPPPGRR
jgi:nucleoside-diphosphate-sugar epimerase